METPIRMKERATRSAGMGYFAACKSLAPAIRRVDEGGRQSGGEPL